MNQGSFGAPLTLVGRVLLVAIFLPEAWVTIRGYGNAVAYVERFGIPGLLLPLAIALEIAAPILIAIGWYTRLAALALAAFSLLTAVVFHRDFSNANQELHFWKNLAMAGGFILLVANGAGAWSIDASARAKSAA